MKETDKNPKPPGWWNNKDRVLEESKKYKTKSQFKKLCPDAYSYAKRTNILAEMTWFTNGTQLYWSTHRKRTREHIIDVARKYNTLKDFVNGSPSEYNAACKFKMISDFTWLKRLKNKDGYWTKEVVLEEAKKYKSRSDFF